MDYAENYTCKAQDAPQGYHWTNVQCTINSIVATYNCLECPSSTITDSIIFISDDLTHDQHAVHLFVGRAIEMLVKDGVRVTKLIQFTDGCACQYKSKTNFADVSHSKEDFSIASEKHFFGSRHGKGPCDREIGVLKKTITMAVASGQVHVGTPMEFYTACKERLSIPKDKGHVHTKRRFVYIEKININRVRPDRSQVQSVKGTRKTHCVIGIKPYTIRVRGRSCFCKACQDDSSSCPNKDITGP